jgi:hypothetical protein
MTEAQLAIQSPCPCEPHKKGTYIYVTIGGRKRRISPLCSSLITLFDWCDVNGWDLDPDRSLFMRKVKDAEA